ncbi:MAG: hypothetical protein J6C98_05105 [Oscillospiraceae bacterium]|nr:hypothetical protein [Oscillospiraceae bacterium]
MNDAEHTIALYQRKAGFTVKIKSALSAIILCLTLLLIGILAVPACILIGLIGTVWSISDTVLKALDR